mmetsp:Transcript_20995/g.53208  ORF Transcript_20995/g.53208 Transcript_20995/m.53208 type:complete len:277 (-) Transcript_20995:35-865(-)
MPRAAAPSIAPSPSRIGGGGGSSSNTRRRGLLVTATLLDAPLPPVARGAVVSCNATGREAARTNASNSERRDSFLSSIPSHPLRCPSNGSSERGGDQVSTSNPASAASTRSEEDLAHPVGPDRISTRFDGARPSSSSPRTPPSHAAISSSFFAWTQRSVRDVGRNRSSHSSVARVSGRSYPGTRTDCTGGCVGHSSVARVPAGACVPGSVARPGTEPGFALVDAGAGTRAGCTGAALVPDGGRERAGGTGGALMKSSAAALRFIAPAGLCDYAVPE